MAKKADSTEYGRITMVPLGTGFVQAEVPTPRVDLRLRDRFRLRCMGWLDAIRYRRVHDSEHTHHTQTLMNHVRHYEAEVLRVGEQASAELHRRIAANEEIVARTVEPDVALPPRDGLADLPLGERTSWAKEHRATTATNARRAAERARVRAATAELAQLHTELKTLEDAVAAVRRSWMIAFEKRGSTYTRARHSLFFGRRPEGAPQVPAYRPVEG